MNSQKILSAKNKAISITSIKSYPQSGKEITQQQRYHIRKDKSQKDRSPKIKILRKFLINNKGVPFRNLKENSATRAHLSKLSSNRLRWIKILGTPSICLEELRSYLDSLEKTGTKNG